MRDASDLLVRFHSSGHGMELFHAFVLWFEATEAKRKSRRDTILKEMENPTGILPQGFEAATEELLEFDILDRIYPVIGDLLDFCCCKSEDSDNAKLVALRDALQIGKYHAPSDTRIRDIQRKCIADWIAEYGALERTKTYLTETAIAKSIGKKYKISYKTALAYWQKFLTREVQTSKHINELVDRVKSRKLHRRHSLKTSIRKVTKPRSWQ